MPMAWPTAARVGLSSGGSDRLCSAEHKRSGLRRSPPASASERKAGEKLRELERDQGRAGVPKRSRTSEDVRSPYAAALDESGTSVYVVFALIDTRSSTRAHRHPLIDTRSSTRAHRPPRAGKGGGGLYTVVYIARQYGRRRSGGGRSPKPEPWFRFLHAAPR